MEQENRLAGQKNYHHRSREELFASQKENCVNFKILKSLVDAPSSTRIIKRYLNEKIRHKKRIHRPGLTMKHKEKQLKYAR